MDYVYEAAAVWLIFNALALWLFKGRWKKAAFVPVAIMAAALTVAVLGGIGGSNLAPIWVVFAIPICFALTICLWIAYGIAWALKLALSRSNSGEY